MLRDPHKPSGMTLNDFKPSGMTLNDFLTSCTAYRPAEDGERPGQRAFNLLSAERYGLARKVMGTDLDPFYDDSRLTAFLNWVADNWTAY